MISKDPQPIAISQLSSHVKKRVWFEKLG